MNTNEIPNYFTSLFAVKDAFYYVAIPTIIFSQVKITHIIFTCEDNHVFARKLTGYFISAFM